MKHERPTIQALLVEDNPAHIFLVQNLVSDIIEFDLKLKAVETLQDAISLLEGYQPDIILFDLGLPDTTTTTGLERLQTLNIDIPVIVLTSNIEPNLPALTFEIGAQDYLTKDNLTTEGLSRAIRYAVERFAYQKALIKAERLQVQIENQRLLHKLMAGINHEFRTPISVIQLAIDTIRNYATPEIIETRYERITTSLNQLIEIGKYISLVTQLGLMEIDTNSALFSDQIEEILYIYCVHHDRVQLNIADNIITYMEESHFQDMLSALIDNALLYSDDSVQVTIEQNQKQTTIAVQDSGIGIEKNDLDKIFLPFYKVSQSRTRLGKEGSGMGLSKAQAIVTAYGGKIAVTSDVGIGSEFMITLPLYH
ncbi:MAG: hybrid sensor histidine kinase/response regulator [Chloroflexota bacterium]